MIEMLVIADDFTGALDTGAQFAKLGIPTRVTCRKTFSASDAQGDGVLCIDAETRHLKSDEAYRTVYGIVASARKMGVEKLFKKVDSTLRGQVAAELAAMLDAGEAGSVAFAPAYPSLGRTTVNGVHMLLGKPIHESVFAKDPFEPTTRSDIAGMIGAFRETPVTSIPLGKSVSERGIPRIDAYDAVTDDDLSVVASDALRGGQRLFAGCAGFAQALARLMAPEAVKTARPAVKKGILAVCGSLNPISDAQIEAARGDGFRYIEIPSSFIDSEDIDMARCGQIADTLSREGESCSRVLLTTSRSGVCANKVTAAARERTAKRIGEVIKAWYLLGRDDTLVVTGGDTLHAFLEDMGNNVTLEPFCELQPGGICSVLRGGVRQRELQIVSKAGGFGTRNVYIDIAKRVLASENTVGEAVNT